MGTEIRLATESDAQQMLAIYAPIVRETTISFEEEVPSIAEFQERIRSVLEHLPWFVCDHDGEVAGYAYASPFKARPGYRWSCEVTVYVHPDYRRRNVGRALYTSLLRALAAQGYCVAVAVITLPNPGSIALHESMGFRRVGAYEGIGHKLGEWLDDGVWQRELSPKPTAPAPPAPYQRLVGTSGWDDVLKAGTACLRLPPQP